MREQKSWTVIHTFIAAFFLIFGLTQTFFNPPFQIPDEPDHWKAAVYRAEQLVQRNDTLCLPHFSLASAFDAMRIAHNPGQKITLDSWSFGNAGKPLKPICLNQPVSYGNILAYPGAALAHFITRGHSSFLSVLTDFYLARILQGCMVFISLLLVLPLLSIPARIQEWQIGLGTTGLLVLILCPKLIQQSFAVSTDAVVNAFALCLAYGLIRRRFTPFSAIWGCWMGICALTTKPIMVPLVPAALLWIGLRTPSKRDRSVLACVATVLSGIAMYSGLTTRALSIVFDQVNPALQMTGITQAPFDRLSVIAAGAARMIESKWIIHQQGWLDFDSSRATVVTFWTSIFALIFGLSHSTPDFKNLDANPPTNRYLIGTNALLLFSLYFSAFLIAFTMYLAFTPVGENTVLGLQGRYFWAHWVLFFAWVRSTRSTQPIHPNPGPPIIRLSLFGALILVSALSLQVYSRASDLGLRYFSQ